MKASTAARVTALENQAASKAVAVQQPDGTMSSVELLAMINGYRKEDGKKTKVNHPTFKASIRREFEGDEAKFESTYLAGNNKQETCYYLPKDECMIMGMKESKFVRRAVMNKLNELTAAVNAQAPQAPAQPSWITDLSPEATLALNDLSSQVQAKTAQIEVQDAQIEVQVEQIEVAKPKVDFFEKVSIGTETYTMTATAKLIGQSPRAFIGYLRDNGFITLTNDAAQKSLNQGLIEQSMGVNEATGKSYTQARVTAKGLQVFTAKLKDIKLTSYKTNPVNKVERANYSKPNTVTFNNALGMGNLRVTLELFKGE